ncbi:hypothetical protein PpBr36_03481 [Pyricularia pennisetigena]|uniref:hypothetical protein n=1 Tax=Pyricularia pennisetigena TaxID=1578925 RepID=UPI0011546D83|nr:hypothetical protein PpBr36_03481 [Pyricularia pennisetigena]TLS30159.1 hypothetical protein PpBr36_03481 [Pyricularia pennisetigena]
MHYPTLYAFLLATAVPAATSLAITSNHQQESASSLIMNVVRRSNEESDEATFARLKRTEADLDEQEPDQAETGPDSLQRRGDEALEGNEFTEADLDSVLDGDGYSTARAGIKHRRRRAITAFVRRSERPIPNGGTLDYIIPHEEKRGLLDGSAGTRFIKADESDENLDEYDDDDWYEDNKRRLSRRGISTMIARRRAKRSLS